MKLSKNWLNVQVIRTIQKILFRFFSHFIRMSKSTNENKIIRKNFQFENSYSWSIFAISSEIWDFLAEEYFEKEFLFQNMVKSILKRDELFLISSYLDLIFFFFWITYLEKYIFSGRRKIEEYFLFLSKYQNNGRFMQHTAIQWYEIYVIRKTYRNDQNVISKTRKIE